MKFATAVHSRYSGDTRESEIARCDENELIFGYKYCHVLLYPFNLYYWHINFI